jgi:hypothetical protein
MGQDCASERVPIALAEGRPEDPIMRIIMARCGDVLTDADLAALGDAAPDPGALPATN